MLGIHEELPLVIQCNKEEPGGRKKQNEAIQNEEGRKGRSRLISTEAIKQKQLRKHDKGKGGVTGLK
jgi:hypothetical protein